MSPRLIMCHSSTFEWIFFCKFLNGSWPCIISVWAGFWKWQTPVVYLYSGSEKKGYSNYSHFSIKSKMTMTSTKVCMLLLSSLLRSILILAKSPWWKHSSMQVASQLANEIRNSVYCDFSFHVNMHLFRTRRKTTHVIKCFPLQVVFGGLVLHIFYF